LVWGSYPYKRQSQPLTTAEWWSGFDGAMCHR